ncbi:GNAT family N-acetyltransferase [Streptomyces zingiberis]|uniref:GNAT family N-acetyltransferase n=1 Tax=Streptomyces zingiberis TaxID=2053010 RepID=A0ABX1BYG4_9ACTN|nr:GNAT family N-acetyltransferase [Streptomyces zingiberis]NJQ00910.1 GNAT family N-acetyltransferase [Streptomyces zingiberis]
MDLVIRTARPEEYPALGALTADAYLGDDLLDFGATDPYLGTLRDAAGRAAHTELLVAADAVDDRPLGCVAHVLAGSPYVEISRPGEGEFRMLAVAREARGRGAGEALVRACLARSREAGHTRVALSTHPRMVSAHRLYRRLGFVRAPERDWEPVPGERLLAFLHEF